MAFQQLSLASLEDLDGGKAAVAFKQLLHRAAADCLDRAGDPAKRKVTMEVTLEPITDQENDCNEVAVQVQVHCTVPKYRTKPYSMSLRKNGVIAFNPDSLDNVNQATLLPDDEDD